MQQREKKKKEKLSSIQQKLLITASLDPKPTWGHVRCAYLGHICMLGLLQGIPFTQSMGCTVIRDYQVGHFKPVFLIWVKMLM